MWEEIGHLNFIQLEGRLDVPGTALLPDLIQAIFDKTRISFKYKKDGKKRIVSPYFLQQNAQHWYLIAYDHDKKGEEAIRVYALNKISDINPSQGEYYKDPSKQTPADKAKIQAWRDEYDKDSNEFLANMNIITKEFKRTVSRNLKLHWRAIIQVFSLIKLIQLIL
jgi:predicted DNA-binding transcriptional regulator YafY